MNLSEINWDLENAGNWPLPVKIFAVIFLSLMLAIAWYQFDTREQLDNLAAEEAKEGELRTAFEIRQKKASRLEAYQIQLVDIEKTFGDLLRQLPNKTQVPELLVEVSQTGLASGLEFELFKPKAEGIQEFYAELPIEVRVLGSYFDFGTFVSGLAALPRIVTVHDIKIGPNKGVGNQPRFPLIMSGMVKTYRYLEEDEMPKKKTAKKPKGRSK